jgi:hypothetical protein
VFPRAGSRGYLKSVLPLHGGLQPPLDPDEHSAELLAAYARRRRVLNERLGCRMGRAQVAVLSRDLDGRKACGYSGRCLWGCPRRSLYTPAITLARCRAFPNFQYLNGFFVDHFRMNGAGKVRSVMARRADGAMEEIAADALVLAAGTLGSAKIFLESIYQDSGQILSLTGLMDNRQILMPFVNLRMLGRKWNPDTYQYHQVVMTVRVRESGEMIHGLITTLKTALIHPLVQTLPFDLAGSLAAFRSVHAALGMININFPDHRRQENYLTLDTSSLPHRLAIHYRSDASEPARLNQTIAAFRRVLWKLGCSDDSCPAHGLERPLCGHSADEHRGRRAEVHEVRREPRRGGLVFRRWNHISVAAGEEPHVHTDGERDEYRERGVLKGLSQRCKGRKFLTLRRAELGEDLASRLHVGADPDCRLQMRNRFGKAAGDFDERHAEVGLGFREIRIDLQRGLKFRDRRGRLVR